MPYIFTCEHGGNHVPVRFRSLFEGREKILNSHRGWDPGALQLARASIRECPAQLFFSETTRLLIDLNRSVHHRSLFSELTRDVHEGIKKDILDDHYYPYRDRVEHAIRALKSRPVIHLSFHSFVPELHGVVRKGDIGLLYDPARHMEREFCLGLQSSLKQCFPELVIRRNYPYRGIADGFTRYLRGRFSERRYLGIEIEVNQHHVFSNGEVWNALKGRLGALLREQNA